ncbi:MAG: Acyl-CoA dehydrogenase type 2 domain protein [Ilumatobacteraceae bacterium]|nr:Acyl-CoA dehydrogenase type 2 domain protein [Ilumatobacteraceae bacterium]
MSSTVTTVGLESADIFTRAGALLEEIRSRGDEIAALRRLPRDLVASLKRAGVFRISMPRAWGGPEMSLPDQIRLVEMLSAADPSVGWCVMIGSDSGFYSAFFDDDAARGLWPDLDMVTAGWIFPGGQATRVDGGYSVSGRWSFGSGSNHADVMLGGCLVIGVDGAPEMDADGLPSVRIMGAPAADWNVGDTWYTTGLAGSGSNDYSCTDLFVPESRSFALSEPVRRSGPLYVLPGAFITNIDGVALGLARRAIDEVIAIAQTKVLMPQFVTMRDVPRVCEAIADAEARLRSARAYTYTTIEQVWEAVSAGEPLTDSLRTDMVLCRSNALRMAREVAVQMVQLAGTQAIYATSVLDRLVRDAITIDQHVVAGPAMHEAAGALALGIQPSGPFATLI